MTRSHDVRQLTTAELELTRRELRANLGLITPGSPAHVPILAHLQAIDAELARRAGNRLTGVVTCGGARETGGGSTAACRSAEPGRLPLPRSAAFTIEDCGDGFDFHQLVLVAEHGDTHQGAGDDMVAKGVPDYLPRGHEIFPPYRGDQDPGAEDVFQRRAGIGEGGPHVLDGLRGLARVVPDRGGRPVLVQGTCPGKEDQP